MHTSEWNGSTYAEQTEYRSLGEIDTTVRFHHNGDYSGNVHIMVNPKVGDPKTLTYRDGSEWAELYIPFAALEQLVLEKIRSQLISDLEHMSLPELVDFVSRI